MKIVIVGLGYVGLSNAVLLAQYNEVIGVDINQNRVDALNARQSPIADNEMSEYLATKDLNLSASTSLAASVVGADYVIISTPTNYDDKKDYFDTSSVEAVISQVVKSEPHACIVVKSTIPVGFIDRIKTQLKTNAVMFSPEFLREGRALYDNLHPSRIIVGEKSQRAAVFAKLLAAAALKKDPDILLTNAGEAEAIKLFSNTYLAMRVAFFNELDSYALSRGMSSRNIIDGVSLDPRIGTHYNNPSFGYGGYCLPKDTKQLLKNYDNVPQNLISAIVEANATRQDFITNIISSQRPRVIGIYRLIMKTDSDNFRQSSVWRIMENLNNQGHEIIIYEPLISAKSISGYTLEKNITKFKDHTDVILANRVDSELENVKDKIFSRDQFGID